MQWLILLFLSSQLFAGINRVAVKNFNLNYVNPFGKGDVEHISVNGGFGTEKKESYPIELERIEDTLVLKTPFMDINWQVGQLLGEMEQIVAQKVSFDVGTNSNLAEGELFIFKPKAHNEYLLKGFKVSCLGESRIKNDLRNKIIENCLNQMETDISKLDIPADSFLIDILTGYPEEIEEEKGSDIPAYDLSFKMNKGDFKLFMVARYYLKAPVRAKGNISFKNDYQTVVIKVDQIKIGFVSVTDFVLRKMKATIKNPKVLIDPPWIYIELKKRKQ